jgi:hypothetical protein
LTGKEHDQTIHTQTYTACWRHANFYGPDEIFIERLCLFVTLLAEFSLLHEPFPLIHGIG